MSIIKKMRKQNAVWWARSSTPDRYGRFSYSAPVQIDCRWDELAEEYRDSKGQTVVSRAICYPDRILGIGDMLREGEIDSNEPADPTTLTTAFEIRQFSKVPNIKATETLYIAHM